MLIESGLAPGPERSGGLRGFGLIRNKKGDYEAGYEMLKRAYEIEPENPRLMVDYAAALATRGRSYFLFKTAWADELLLQSERLCESAAQNAPNQPLIYWDWAVALYYQRQYAQAWEKARRAEALGGVARPDYHSFLSALRQKMDSPCPRK